MKKLEIATLGAGCFWCVEAIFMDLRGVEKVESGYAGGHVKNPSYKEVCAGNTGHAEVIQITYNPDVISYQDILEVFWNVHNPTTLNRQGNDIGPQYRSAIFYHDETQKVIAEQSIQEAAKDFKDPIVTEITPLSNYSTAEDYHQNYFNEQGHTNNYCQLIVAPKIAKFRKNYSDKLKEEVKK